MPVIPGNAPSPAALLDTPAPAVDVADDVATAAATSTAADAAAAAPAATTTAPIDGVDAPGTAAPLPSGGLPADPAKSPLATRLAAISGGAEASLVEQRAFYGMLIDSHTRSIATLEGDLKVLDDSIARKTAEATSLMGEQDRLLKAIAEKQGLAIMGAMYGGVLAIVSLGASAIAAGATIAASTAAIAGYQSQLRDVERRRSSINSELQSLNDASRAYAAQRSQLGQRLTALKSSQAELEAARAAASPVSVEQLRRAVAVDKSLVANLEAQIGVLQTMKSAASGMDAALDKLIAALRSDVAALNDQLERANRQVITTLVDVVLTGFGATAALKIEGLPLSQKQVVLAGIDLARGDPATVANACIQSLISNGLVAATDSNTAGALLTTLLTPSRNAAADAEKILEGAGAVLSAEELALVAALTSELSIPTLPSTTTAPVSGERGDGPVAYQIIDPQTGQPKTVMTPPPSMKWGDDPMYPRFVRGDPEARAYFIKNYTSAPVEKEPPSPFPEYGMTEYYTNGKVSGHVAYQPDHLGWVSSTFYSSDPKVKARVFYNVLTGVIEVRDATGLPVNVADRTKPLLTGHHADYALQLAQGRFNARLLPLPPRP